MKNIKFRVWDGEAIISLSMAYTRGLVVIQHDDKDSRWSNDLAEEFDNVMLMQFTGIKDKQGKEIYEGDIIEVCENKNSGLLVEFVNAYVGGWVLSHPSTDRNLSLGARVQSELEVIGNIHQNPELIKPQP